MAFVDWSNTYSVGIREIDDQHKELVGLINALHSLNKSNNREIVGRVLVTLVEYIKKHFSLEENLMKEMRYPDLEPHMNQHRSFSKKIEEFQKAYENDTQPLSDELMNFLRMWLTNHILIQDKSYSVFKARRNL